MAKCSTCRKNDALDTRWDKIRYRLFMFLFPKDIVDLSQDKFTQGFADGYQMGFKHGTESLSYLDDDFVSKMGKLNNTRKKQEDNSKKYYAKLGKDNANESYEIKV